MDPKIMKTIIQILLATVLFVAASFQTHAQDTLLYDQQSATSPYSIHDNFVDGFNIQEDSPLMQSFVPSLSAIGFVQFEFIDTPNNGNNGATVYVNLWTGSPNARLATLLGSTASIYMPNGFMIAGLGGGVTNFYFSTPVALTPGQTYYLQPVVFSGDDPWEIMTIGNTYPNGLLYGGAGGFTAPFEPSVDLWFREGVIPEPQPAILALAGLAVFFALSRKRRRISLLILAVSLISFGPHMTRAQTGGNYSSRSHLALPLPADLRLVPPNFQMSGVTTWYSLQRWSSGVAPAPMNWLAYQGIEVTVCWSAACGGNVVWLDDTAISYPELYANDTVPGLATRSAMDLPDAGDGGADQGLQPNAPSPLGLTGGLLVECLSQDSTNFWLRLHGTVGGDTYQLLSTSNEEIWLVIPNERRKRPS